MLWFGVFILFNFFFTATFPWKPFFCLIIVVNSISTSKIWHRIISNTNNNLVFIDDANSYLQYLTSGTSKVHECEKLPLYLDLYFLSTSGMPLSWNNLSMTEHLSFFWLPSDSKDGTGTRKFGEPRPLKGVAY